MSNINIFTSANILLPEGLDGRQGEAYAVIACDQFTSEPEYWEKCRALTSGMPTTLDLILPEVYLEDEDELVPKINAAMERYTDGILKEHLDSMIYLRRTQPDGRVRCGIVGKIDLEYYSYENGAESLIRPTEKTVIERIPPRIKIRENAKIELPHVMLLVNDEEKTLIEPIAERYKNFSKAYDFDLMFDAGHVEGYFLDEREKRRITLLLARYSTLDYSKRRYGRTTEKPLLFAVGDGNHSLATAKAVYEALKSKYGMKALGMPERYALCEFVNIHDTALDFEPIYRIVKCECSENVHELTEYIKSECKAARGECEPYKISLLSSDTEEEIVITHPVKNLPVAFLQELIDKFEDEHPECVTDYIHGENSLRMLSREENTVGFLFGGMDKSELFKSVVLDGVLPRKTFSMGHALDKRHYIEARKIKHSEKEVLHNG